MAGYTGYTTSKAFAGRGTVVQYSTNPPSVAYTTASELKTAAFSGAKYDLADVSNLESGNFKEWLPTTADSGECSMSGNYLPNSAAELAMIGFFTNATLVTWQLVLPPSAAQGFPTTLGTFTFTGYISSIDYGLETSKEATIAFKIKITGAIAFSGGS
jgi:hypothetical protein